MYLFLQADEKEKKLRRYKLIKRVEVFVSKASKTAGHEFEDFRFVLGVKKRIFSYFIIENI